MFHIEGTACEGRDTEELNVFEEMKSWNNMSKRGEWLEGLAQSDKAFGL